MKKLKYQLIAKGQIADLSDGSYGASVVIMVPESYV